MDFSNRQTRIAVDRGGESLSLMRKAFLRAAAEMEQYESSYAETSDIDEKSRIMNAAILYACTNVVPSARIELAADSQAKLAAAKELQP